MALNSSPCPSMMEMLGSQGYEQLYAITNIKAIGMPTKLLMKILGLIVHRVEIRTIDNKVVSLFFDFLVTQIYKKE